MKTFHKIKKTAILLAYQYLKYYPRKSGWVESKFQISSNIYSEANHLTSYTDYDYNMK